MRVRIYEHEADVVGKIVHVEKIVIDGHGNITGYLKSSGEEFDIIVRTFEIIDATHLVTHDEKTGCTTFAEE